MKMQAALKPLQDKLENFNKISKTTNQKQQHIKVKYVKVLWLLKV